MLAQSELAVPKARILPSGYRGEAVATREQKITWLLAGCLDVIVDSIACRFAQLEPHGLAGLSLTHGGAVKGDAIRGDILNFKRDNVAAPQLAVDRKVEHGQVACSTFDLELCPDRPDVFWAKRRLRSNQSAFIPRCTR
ncbi:hypothetical protein [Rhodoblastus sp.]|uniref:hypothetical protein n=1 Tax=Rhodoblastus sp. TaxID=1962975 RepID=UPI003F94894B